MEGMGGSQFSYAKTGQLMAQISAQTLAAHLYLKHGCMAFRAFPTPLYTLYTVKYVIILAKIKVNG